LGPTSVKAAHKMLMKLKPGQWTIAYPSSSSVCSPSSRRPCRTNRRRVGIRRYIFRFLRKEVRIKAVLPHQIFCIRFQLCNLLSKGFSWLTKRKWKQAADV
jgi:hypothetical protein